MKKLQHVQRTISLATGDAQKEAYFSDIQGPIVGYSLVPFGAMPGGIRADLMIQDGATTVLMPIDIAVPDVTTKSSFRGSICELMVENPGDIKATIIPTQTLEADQVIKVKVIIYYAVEATGHNSTSINDCL